MTLLKTIIILAVKQDFFAKYRQTSRVPLVEQEMLTLPEHLSSPPFFCEVRVILSLDFFVMFCRSLFGILIVFVWPLCLSFDLWILITPLVSSISSSGITSLVDPTSN